LESARRQREDVGWQGLVRLYETMRPRDAATIFNELAMPTLIEVVDRMKESKAAPIMAAMVPDKARDVTTQLSRLRLARSAAPGAANP
jgi:flagellar motility protein MotE (MotC chaperone)